MKTLLILTFLLSYHVGLSQVWNQTEDFPGTPRDDGAGFKLGDVVYFGTGLDNSFATKRDFYAFDLTTESWSPVASLPIGKERQYATGANYNNEGYLFGGIDGDGNYLSDLWKYNPITNSWQELTSLPSFGRSGMVNFIVNDTLYIVGGKTLTNNSIGEVWSYSLLTGDWIQKNDIGLTEIWRGIGTSLYGIGYIGYGKMNNGSFNDRLYLYDIPSDSWSVNMSLITIGRVYPAYSEINNELYIYGGELSSGSYSNDLLRFSPVLNTIVPLTSFTANARRGAFAFASNEDFYLTTGVTSTNRTNETWKSEHVVDLTENLTDNINLRITNQKVIGFDNLTNPVNIEIIGVDGRVIYKGMDIQQDFNHNIKNGGGYFIHAWNSDFSYKTKFIIL